MEIRVEQLEIVEATEQDKEEWAVILEPGTYYVGVVFDDTYGPEHVILRTAPQKCRNYAELLVKQYKREWDEAQDTIALMRRDMYLREEKMLKGLWAKYHPKLVGKIYYYRHRTYGPCRISDEEESQ